MALSQGQPVRWERGSPLRAMDLSDLIARNAAFAPDKPALRYDGATLTYAALAQRITAAARLPADTPR